MRYLRCLSSVVSVLYTVLATDNIALNKTTIQSGTGYSGISRYAVDGNPDPEFYHYSCTFATPGSSLPYSWWAVDLDNVYEITEVVISRRTGFSLRDLQLEMYMNSPLICQDQPAICSYIGPELSARHQITCENGAIGRYLMIRHTASGPSEITLCEVEVFGQKLPSSPGVDCHELIKVSKEVNRGLNGNGVISGNATSRVGCAVECMQTGHCAAFSFNILLGVCEYSAGLVNAYSVAKPDWESYRIC